MKMICKLAVSAAVLLAGILPSVAEDVTWTDADTEWLWARIADNNARTTSTAPRFYKADEETGEGELEAFGTQYLPNAYAYYQEVRATAKEREQVLQENFPEGRASDTTGGALYDKVQKACAKSVAEMFRRHDELCHFLLLHRMGVMTDRDLTDLDSSRIAVVLPEEAGPPVAYARSAPALAAAERDFATKYLPEVWAAFQRLDSAFSEGVRNYAEWRNTAQLIDATRSDALFMPLRDRLDGILAKMDFIVRIVKEMKLLHAVGEMTAAELAEEDHVNGLALQTFEKNLPIGPVVLASVRSVTDRMSAPLLMVPIPGKNYRMGKYEVTQALWKAVMGENRSWFKGANNPVENVSWDDCQEFLRKLNTLPSVKASGMTFRLPTEEEWEYACRARATGDYCKLASGTEITEDTLGQVAWHTGNSNDRTHPVGQKKPNAFGLYDMHGNVWEWTSTADGDRDRVSRGGGWHSGGAKPCRSSDLFRCSHSNRFNYLGFRLCASGRAD